MAGRGRIVVRHGEVTARAELAVELAREVVEAGDRSDRDLGTVGAIPAPVLRAEDDARPLALPGGLDLPDHPRVREQQRRIVVGDERRTGHDAVPVLLE